MKKWQERVRLMKWPTTPLEWVHLYWIGIAGVAAACLVGALLKKIDVDWDFLAFAGSIIGGVITWRGVRATINNGNEKLDQEKKEKEFDKIPEKTRILDQILRELDRHSSIYIRLIDNLSGHLDSGVFYVGHRDITYDYIVASKPSSLLSDMHNIVDLSIKVDSRTYRLLYSLEKLIYHTERLNEMHEALAGTDGYTVQDAAVDVIRDLEILKQENGSAYDKVLEIRNEYLKTLFPNDEFPF